MHTATQRCQSRSIGSPFYSVSAKTIYWEYEAIATVYKGFSLSDIKRMSVRQRDFWYRMAKWRTAAH